MLEGGRDQDVLERIGRRRVRSLCHSSKQLLHLQNTERAFRRRGGAEQGGNGFRGRLERAEISEYVLIDETRRVGRRLRELLAELADDVAAGACLSESNRCRMRLVEAEW